MRLINSLFASILFVVLSISYVLADTKVTYKSAKSTSSYYQMAVELSEAMKNGSNGEVIITVAKYKNAGIKAAKIMF